MTTNENTKTMNQEYKTGERVYKVGGDYTFSGRIVSAFQKKSGAWRYVVENRAGLLHIFSGKQLHSYK